MKTLFDAASIADIQRRMRRLQPDSPAHWGRMCAAEMVCHLIGGFRIPVGEEPVTVRRTPLRIYPLRWLRVYVPPWPKGKLPTTPEFQRTQPTAQGRTKPRGEPASCGLSSDTAGWIR